MSKWIAGNQPEEDGEYWVTLKDGKVVRASLIYSMWPYAIKRSVIAYQPITPPEPFVREEDVPRNDA